MDLSHRKDHELKEKAVEMYVKFDKYWDGMKNINKMLIVATIFWSHEEAGSRKHVFWRALWTWQR